MARKPRISYPGALHHVIVRGNHKEQIFLNDRDRKRFIELLKEYHERFLFKCYAYSLMANHIHLLMEEGDIPLSKIMQGINQSYTQYFNTKHENVGHLFQGRYRAILCDKDRYLIVLVRYIHLNPVRALLVKKPEDYRWSSHNFYISSDESFIDKDFVLSVFGKTRKEAVKRYREFIYEGIGQKAPSDFETGFFLADDEFIENIIKKYDLRCKEKVKISLDDIAVIVADMFNIDKRRVFSKSQSSRVSFVRGVIGYFAREIANISIKEIGSFFNRDPSTLTHSIRGVIDKMKNDSEISEIIQELKVRLKKKEN